MFKSQVLKLFRKAFGPWVTAAPPRPRVRPTFKPRLEPLEDRIAPATYTVSNTNDAGNGSLRQAMTQLQNSNDANNTINVAAGVTGTITLESQLPTISKNVNITGPGASNLTVTRDPNAKTQFPIFWTNPDTTASITGLTISGGSVNATTNGGGIFNQGNLTLTNDTITNNSAANGGGIYNNDGFVTLSGVSMWGNTASGSGGGIYNGGTFNISNSEIYDNTAQYGGGAYNVMGESMTIGYSSFFLNGASKDGGGIDNAGTLVWNGGSLYENGASNDGAGVNVVSGGTSNLTNVKIWDTNIPGDGNIAGNNGGGFFIWKGSVTLTSCTLSDNGAKVGAGGAYVQGQGTVTINGGTITDPIVPVNQG